MFIRSQDKKELIDITGKRVYVWYGTKGWSIYVDPMTVSDDVSVCLGGYGKDGEERAVEVLDEIQNTMEFSEDINIFKRCDEEGFYVEQPKLRMYEMPKQ